MKIGVIGGGIIGYCSAYFLQKSGHQVTIFEKSREAKSPSFWNAGMVVPSHFIPLASPGVIAKGIKWMFKSDSPFYIKPRLNTDLARWLWKFYQNSTAKHVETSAHTLLNLNQASNRLFDQIIAEHKLKVSKKDGLLMVYNSQKGEKEEKEIAEKANQLGVETRILDVAGLSDIDQSIQYKARGAIFDPGDAFLSPGNFMQGLEDVLVSKGVEVHKGEEVSRFLKDGRRVKSVITSSGEFEVDELVLASGIDSFSIGANLGLYLPMQGGKGYSVTVQKPSVIPKICSILTEAKVTVTPMEGNLRLAGTMEIAGTDLTISRKRVNGFLKSVAEYIPAYSFKEFERLDVWSGLRPCSPDGLPYIGKASTFENVVVCTGHAMMGFSMGPISGKLVSELVADSIPSVELTKLSPDRFK